MKRCISRDAFLPVLIAVFFLTAFSGCLKRPGPSVRFDEADLSDPEATYREILSRCEAIRTLQGTAHLRLQTEQQKASLDAVIACDRHGRLRFEILDLLNHVVFLAIFDPKGFLTYSVSENEYMEGPEDPEQIREMLGIPLQAEELTALALGDPFFLPVSDPIVRISVDQNALLLDVGSSGLGPRYLVWLDENKRPAKMFVMPTLQRGKGHRGSSGRIRKVPDHRWGLVPAPHPRGRYRFRAGLEGRLSEGPVERIAGGGSVSIRASRGRDPIHGVEPMNKNEAERSARGIGTPDRMAGRVALVTGGARKFGASVCRHLAGQGYRVVINYRTSRAQAEALAERIRGRGGQAMPCQADVTRERDVHRMIDRVKRSFGRLDVLINNVGDYLEKPLARVSTKEWEAIIQSNLTSAFLCSKEALPLMRKKKKGRIVMIGYAPAGKLSASPRCAVYHLAKTGALILAKSMAVEEAPHGITVNMISPGTIFNSVKKPSRTASDYIPAGRFCRYADLLGMLDYLLSEEAAYVTAGHFR